MRRTPSRTGAWARARTLLACCAAGALCATAARAQSDEGIQRIARQVTPAVERAVGLSFKRPPRIAVRSREQVRAYLDRKLAEDYPPGEIAAMQRAYRALHLIGDTLDLRSLILDMYAEQVAGYYDPDSSALFVVRGANPTMVRVVLAHELVHALQDQYTPLARILKLRRQNDRQMAAEAVMEGQATVASMVALAPGGQVPDFTRAWDQVRAGLRDQQAAMPVFAAAPRFIQESLLFPYLAGGEFIEQFDALRAGPGEQPYNDRLPISTEQILHPAKYSAHERPARILIAAPAPRDTLLYADDFGEFETRTGLESWGVADQLAVAAASGWNGDRYQILGTPAGTVVVWASAWDTPRDADEFAAALREGWGRATAGATGRRWRVDTLDASGLRVVRLVDAPERWTGWGRLPAVRATGVAGR